MRRARFFGSRNGGGILEELLRSTRDLVADTLLDSVKDATREILRRTMTVGLLYVVAALLMGTGLILLLIGGFEALRLIPLPAAVAYALMGLLGLGGGFAAVQAARSRNRD